ncbi:MAG: hypothetical protein ACREJO_09830 [Phycisphaerales bacterium]
MKKNLLIVLAGALAVPSLAMAQFSITPGGTNSGNGLFAQGAPTTTMAGTGQANANLFATTTSAPDQAFQDAWFFRAAGDTRERAFGTQVSGGYAGTSVLVGNNANTLDTGGYDHTVTNTNTANPYAFSAQLRWQIAAGPNGPVVTYTAVVTNLGLPGTAPLALSMFHYNDMDALGTAGTDVYSYSAGTFSVSEGTTNLFHSGVNATAYQAAVFAGNRITLNDTAVTTLNNTVVGSPGDYTGAFQWDLTIAAGASATITGQFGFVVPTPGAAALLGLGGFMVSRRRR